ncbi:hypothetical protein [Vibrio parahaemolyticus]|uniref:hypothetical protein n=1 Tax=Vibrio parahaemolyticus TaxID=670 RepID=UPI00215C00E6|nr:hypothetical protein [Vibrio parahaemolyticus]MCR9764530.1 hypothetical protein [Vibrio parahaemolyticus]
MSGNPPPKGRNYPFAQRHSASWETCHVTYDQAVEMFYDQTAMQQYLGHDPVVNSLVYKKVTYPTIFDAQRAYTQDQNAFYQEKEQEQLALEARGIKAFKNMNDAIRSRLNPTEDGLANPLERPLKPMGEVSKGIFEQLTSELAHAPSGRSAEIASVQPNSPEINPNNMYWPPYNFLAKDGEKEIHIRYTQDVVETTVLAPEEWKEFFDSLDKVQNIGGAMKGTYDAFDTAKKLGGLGVTAYVKTHNGVDYLILKGYKQHMKTLLAGNRFKASNPQVVKLSLGALDSVKGMARYVKVTAPMEILVGSAINVLKYVLDDEYTLKDLGVDEAKLLVNVLVVAGTALAIGTLAVPTTVLGTAMILVSASLFIWTVDQTTDFEKKLVNLVLENFDD